MVKKSLPVIPGSDRAQRPDFSIPTAAERHRGAALRYMEAARRHRKAAKLHDSGQHEKAGRHAHLAKAHHLRAEQDADEAAKAYM